MKYKIEMIGPDQSSRTYPTLKAARAALRRANGGRLHGKYYPADAIDAGFKTAYEGWNLGPQEGCDTAIIHRLR